MNKFINVTVDGKVLSVNVNHIVALQQNDKACYIYLPEPVGVRYAAERKSCHTSTNNSVLQ